MPNALPPPAIQDTNILLRGQSNAGYFDLLQGAQDLTARVQALLRARGVPGTVHLLGGINKTEFSGAGFTIQDDRRWLLRDGATWHPAWREQALLDYVASLPAAVRAAPTITLWLHNETDELDTALTPALWAGAVRADAGWVRARLGQAASSSPYMFVWVPFWVPWDSALDARAQMIRQGMAALVADAGFHAVAGPQTGDLDMTGTGDRMHMNKADSAVLAARLAPYVAAVALRLHGDAAAAAALLPAPFDAVAARLAGPGQVAVRLSAAPAPLADAAASGAGWSLRAGDARVAASAQRVAGEGVVLSFPRVPAGARLFYAYGHGQMGQRAAVYDAAGTALVGPVEGLDVEEK